MIFNKIYDRKETSTLVYGVLWTVFIYDVKEVILYSYVSTLIVLVNFNDC